MEINIISICILSSITQLILNMIDDAVHMKVALLKHIETADRCYLFTFVSVTLGAAID